MDNYYLIDTHTHPQFPQYDKDRDEVIKRALDKKIGLICVGTDFQMSQKAIELAEQYDGMYATVGLHPNDEEEFDREKYLEMLKHEKVIAIGETGLDYYRTKGEDKLKKQKERFLMHVELAKETNLPLVIHCRDAHKDMISLLSQEQGVRGVIHSFTGTADDAKKYFDLGLHLGLNGIITFARNYDDAIRSVPLENIILETDAPYLTPEPYRGKRNESAYVEEVCHKLATLINVEHSYVATQTVDNSRKLFGI